ncbi:MAG: NAD-dependent epimerase/dehydratase family protein [Candidatus Reddybacter sp.]
MAKILLLGCGSLGRKLACRLIAAQHTVIAVKRRPLRDPLAGLQVLLVDITVASMVELIPTDVDLVVCALAPAERNAAAYQSVFQGGMQRVLAHFARSISSRRPHWLMVSSTSVYGQDRGQWVDESSPAEASSFNGQALIQAEQQLWAHCANSIVLRFSGIYGPGRESLIRRVREGRAMQYDPPCYSNRIHEADCLGILCFLIARSLSGKPLDKLYLVSDSAAVPLGEVALWLSEEMSCPPPPARPANVAIKGMNKRCRNDRLLALGYVLRYRTYRQGYGELLEPT